MISEDNTHLLKDIRFWLLMASLIILLTLIGNSYVQTQF